MSPVGRGGVPSGGGGCCAAVTSVKPTKPAWSAHNPPTAHNLAKRHNLRKAHITKKSKIMYIKLIRNQPKGSAITGRLVIDGRYFCDTLERAGYQIPALCYPLRVTMSPKFKRLLPLVTGVPRSIVQNGVELSPAEKTTLNHSTQPLNHSTPSGMRTGIRFHVGTKPEHSTGCILVPNRAIEKELTDLILKAQDEHEEIILEVSDFTSGTQYGYDHPCPPELQMP